MGNAITAAIGAGFTGGGTATLANWSNDECGIVTIATGTVVPAATPAAPAILFTLTFAGSFNSVNAVPAKIDVSANTISLTAAQEAAGAACGPFAYVWGGGSAKTKVDVYMSNPPAAGITFDLAYSVAQS